MGTHATGAVVANFFFFFFFHGAFSNMRLFSVALVWKN